MAKRIPTFFLLVAAVFLSTMCSTGGPSALPPPPRTWEDSRPVSPRDFPPPPRPRPVSRPPSPKPLPTSADAEKALRLFRLARHENRSLTWDECLARKAYQRARDMVRKGYFEHEDPGTGDNPAWDLVISCRTCRFAGENLAKGSESAEVIHQALMDSQTHRKNILDPRFDLMGVGCYQKICVQLFAGL